MGARVHASMGVAKKLDVGEKEKSPLSAAPRHHVRPSVVRRESARAEGSPPSRSSPRRRRRRPAGCDCEGGRAIRITRPVRPRRRDPGEFGGCGGGWGWAAGPSSCGGRRAAVAGLLCRGLLVRIE